MVSKDGCTNDSLVVGNWSFIEATVSVNRTSTETDDGQRLVNFEVMGVDDDSNICSQVRSSFQVENSGELLTLHALIMHD